MAGLETINDVVGQKVWDELEQRLPNALDGAAKKMADTAAFFKANPISFGGSGNIKQDTENTIKLTTALNDLHKVNERLTKDDAIAARVAKDRSIEEKNLAQARLANAKATDIEERAQQRKIAADLKEAESIKKKKQAQAQPDTSQSSYSGASDTLQDAEAQAGLAESQRQAQEQANEAAGATNAYSEALKSKTAAEISDTGAIEENLSASQQLSETLIVAKAELDAVNVALKQNTIDYRSGKISEAEYVANGRNLIKQQSELKAIVSTTNSELTKQTKANLAASGSMEKLSVDLEILKAEYKALNAEQRASPFGIALQENIKKADANIKTLSSTIGENQRKVGDYTGGITKAFSGAFGFLRQIAYIVPGLGMAGIFNLAYEAIEKVVSGLSDASEETKKYKEELDKVATSSNENAQKEINKLTILTKIAQDENKTRKQRLEAVEQLQKIFPDYFKGLSQETILYGDITNAIKLSTESILANAKAKAYAGQADVAADRFVKEKEALDKATKAASDYYGKNSELIEQQRKNAEIVAAQGANARSSGVAQTGALTKFITLEKERQEALDKTVEAQKDIIKYQNLAAGNANDVLDLVGGTQSKSPVDHSAQMLSRQEDKDRAARLAAEKELSDAIRANRAALAEENIQVNKKVYEDETKSLEVRMEAYSEYYAARNQQAKLNGQKELSDVVALEAEIARVEAEPEAKRSNADKELLLRKEGIAERRKGIEYKLQADLAEIQTQASADSLKILESYSNHEIQILEQRISALKDANYKESDAELKNLVTRLSKHEISWRNYQKEKNNIILKATKESTDKEIAAIYNVLLYDTLSVDARIALEKKLYALKKKNRETEQQSAEDTAKEDIRKFQKTVDDISGIASQVGGSFFDFKKKILDNQLEQLDEEASRVQRNLQLELEAINAKGLAEDERIKQTTEAQARADAKLYDIEQQKRQRQIDQARFDKAQAIFNIILNTAVSVSKLLAEPPLAIAAAALGAAQLAVASATPLPKYAKGTLYHPGGDAIVGDGGEREWIEDGSKSYWSPSSPTVINLGVGAKVTPESKLLDMANADAMRNLTGIVTPEAYATAYIQSFERLIGGVSKGMDKLTDTVKNKKEAYVNITGKGMEYFTIQANNRTTYLNKNVRF